MSKELFKKNVKRLKSFYVSGEYRLRGSEEGAYENMPARVKNLYMVAQEDFAPLLHAIGERNNPDFTPEHLVFDFPQITKADHEKFAAEILKNKELGLPEPLFLDLNYITKEGNPVFGFRFFDKGDGKVWVKVINCPGFYLLENGTNIYYGAKDVKDGNDINILISRLYDYFLEKEPSQVKIS